MTKTTINHEIAGLTKALKDRGVDIKQSDVTEAMASARGFRNSHAMMAHAQKEAQHPADILTGANDAHAAQETTGALELMTIERDELRERLEDAERMCFFDWPSWTKSIKGLVKTSHHRKGPVDDEILEKFRLAVANNTCKSSSSERSSAEYSVMELAKKYGAGLLARLDRAEELLGKGQVMDGPLLEKISQLYEVAATRDGHSFDQLFFPEDGVDPKEQGVLIMAKAMSIEDQYAEEEGYEREEHIDFLRGEFDTFDCGPAALSLTAAEMVAALNKGEASVEVNLALQKLAMRAGIDPRGKSGIIYPKMES